MAYFDKSKKCVFYVDMLIRRIITTAATSTAGRTVL